MRKTLRRFLRLVPVALALPAGAAVLPYPVRKETLPNGLDVVVIETPEFKDVLSFNTLVLAGSGNEYEKGKTGLAHLFEHILFRHRYKGEEGGYDERMNRLGTHNNAWTWFDVTYYHPLTFVSNLERQGEPPGLLELEASRFVSLDFNEKTFKTEAGAVLGEYRKLATNPSMRLEERALELMFGAKAYGHTTMGYLPDVEDMPNHFEAARRFYDDWYRPGNCVLVVAGDVKADRLLPKLRERYAAWKPKPREKAPEAAAPPPGPRSEHVPWDADVAPLAWVAYRTPRFEPGSRDSAAAQLLSELLVSPASPLFKKLRYEKQTASQVGFEEGTQGFESFEPRLLVVSAQLFKEKLAEKGRAYFDDVTGDIVAGLDDLKDFSKQPDAAKTLETVKSKYRYDFLAQLDSAESIARVFAWYYRFSRDPAALDRLLESVQAVGPEDIDRFARAAFTPERRAILTLAKGEAKK